MSVLQVLCVHKKKEKKKVYKLVTNASPFTF